MSYPSEGLRALPLTRRRGFSLIEVCLAVVVFAILAAIGMPRVSTFITKMRVQRATTLVATDLEQALVMAGRQRKPLRLDCNCAGMIYTVADRTGGTVRLTRALGADADYKLTTLSFTAAPVDIFPSGVTSVPDTVTIGAGGYSRRIVMTTAGQVRILP